MVEIAVQGGSGDPDALVEVGQRALALVGRERAELSVLLCDDAFIQPLNAQLDKKADCMKTNDTKNE